MENFFLKQLEYNNNIFLKSISINYDIGLHDLTKKYPFSKLDKNIKIKSKPIKIYKYLYIDSNNKYYIVFKNLDLKFNAIVINL
uniref:Uncharacterized protein n=1 Tax=viral metagenome TaxID=1070528 RepID=A0A6C0IXL3_9ZZZZ